MSGFLSSAGKSIGDIFGMTGESRIKPQTGNAGTDKLNAMLSDPEIQKMAGAGGSDFATQQFQNNPLMSQIFGGNKLGDQMSKLTGMQDQQFQLKPEDKTMYGQMSGDIARQFGQQGQKAAAGLAQRGLGAAPSGAAGATFSGLAGNQNEALAKAQQNIMQQRHQDNMQALGQQMNFVNQMQQGAQQGIQGQFGRNLSGLQEKRQGAEAASGAQQRANELNLQAQKAQEETRAPTFGEMLGQGLGSSMYQTGAAPGQFKSSVAGKAGSMVGSGGSPLGLLGGK